MGIVTTVCARTISKEREKERKILSSTLGRRGIDLEISNWDIVMLSFFARIFLLAFLLLFLGGAGDALLFGWLAR